MVWNTCSDTLSVSIGSSEEVVPTKRSIISDIARTFDVLGLLSPSTILMKIVFQLKLAWDEEIPLNIQQQHKTWREHLTLIKDKEFSRCYFYQLKATHHSAAWIFGCSENAYAAVVYVRATYQDQSPTLTLVTSKTKVAPLRKM